MTKGRMAALWKNRLILCLLIKQRARHARPVRRILVVSTTALGDTLWTADALTTLRGRFPQAYIAVLTSPTGLQILQHNPHINRLHVLQKSSFPHFVPLLFKLRRAHYDSVLLFHASQRLIVPLCTLTGASILLGTAGQNKGLDSLLTEAIEKKPMEHELERRLQIVRQLESYENRDALKKPTSEVDWVYFIQPQERAWATEFLGKKKGHRIIMHPGSKEPFRRWPAHCFAEVGRELERQHECEILLTGTPSELPLLQQIHNQLPTSRILCPPSIRQLAALLEQADLVLSNDTGPLHLACALQRPAVGIYCSTDPLLCGPRKTPQTIILARPPTCRPCLKRRCGEPFCFLQIPSSEVIEACTNLLEKGYTQTT